MAALRSLDASGEILPVVTGEILAEQRERVRLGQCLVCGKSRYLCDCGEYDQAYDRRDYGDSEGEF